MKTLILPVSVFGVAIHQLHGRVLQCDECFSYISALLQGRDTFVAQQLLCTDGISHHLHRTEKFYAKYGVATATCKLPTASA